MAKSNKILKIMKDHHALIETLFNEFKNNLGKEDAEELLGNFRWELQKHFLVEEEVVFRVCDESIEAELCKLIPNLTAQHDSMIKILNTIEKSVPNIKDADVNSFQTLLESHKEMEEKNVYSELDSKLDKKEKEIMVARISGIPIKRR